MTSVSLQSEIPVSGATAHADRLAIALSPYRVVVAFVLGSLLWKGYAYPAIFAAYAKCELTDPFFPLLLRNVYVLAAFLLVPMAMAVLTLFTENRTALRVQAIVISLGMFGLCVHQGSYNDASFVTCFWVSLWCVWYTFRIDDSNEQLIAHARLFAILIISMIFLGGAAGKMTPGYWSGEVFYDIYFVDRDFWFFNLLRANLGHESLREFATYYSRMVIVVECACVFLWLLPSKIAASLTIAVLLGLTLFSNVNLFSVTLCLFGICLFVLHEPKRKLK